MNDSNDIYEKRNKIYECEANLQIAIAEVEYAMKKRKEREFVDSIADAVIEKLIARFDIKPNAD